ncbi:MAG: type II toxin-antitoxin system HigB family toxin [Alphaproteobacteria bacterium]|nr:type II toxin-antitoxin system HigB family toxin [Alphaproteobacteria bacterium]
MRVIAKRTIRQFWDQYPDAERALRDWYAVAPKADWAGPAAVKEQFRNASIVGRNRVVFNIAGNKYRLVAMIRYDYRYLFIRFVGTHRAYDKIDASKV